MEVKNPDEDGGEDTADEGDAMDLEGAASSTSSSSSSSSSSLSRLSTKSKGKGAAEEDEVAACGATKPQRVIGILLRPNEADAGAGRGAGGGRESWGRPRAVGWVALTSRTAPLFQSSRTSRRALPRSEVTSEVVVKLARVGGARR